jgi:predicted RNA binding protein YcfA (HicA-like mRNA interferase family)
MRTKVERNSRKLMKILEKDGWQPVAQKGSHIQLKHPVKPGRVTLPHPNRDLPVGTAMSIYRQAGLKPSSARKKPGVHKKPSAHKKPGAHKKQGD